MSPSQPNNPLQLDNPQLYYLLGALLDAIGQAGPLPRQQVINVLMQKAKRSPPVMRASMQKLIGVMKNG